MPPPGGVHVSLELDRAEVRRGEPVSGAVHIENRSASPFTYRAATMPSGARGVFAYDYGVFAGQALVGGFDASKGRGGAFSDRELSPGESVSLATHFDTLVCRPDEAGHRAELSPGAYQAVQTFGMRYTRNEGGRVEARAELRIVE